VGQSDLSSRIQNGYINGIYYDITYQSDDYNGLYLATWFYSLQLDLQDLDRSSTG